MFIAASPVHAVVLESAARQWHGRDIYVACSGNFTVERILAQGRVGAIHSNDVSIYSCALGWHLAGQAVPTRSKSRPASSPGWENYLEPGPATIATLLLPARCSRSPATTPTPGGCRASIGAAGRNCTPKRRAGHEGHGQSAYRGVFRGDCREFLAKADRNAVCISSRPPTKADTSGCLRNSTHLRLAQPNYEIFSPD